jgi:hypothetical protein
LQKRLSAAEEEDDFSWDIEDEDDVHVKWFFIRANYYSITVHCEIYVFVSYLPFRCSSDWIHVLVTVPWVFITINTIHENVSLFSCARKSHYLPVLSSLSFLLLLWPNSWFTIPFKMVRELYRCCSTKGVGACLYLHEFLP